MKKLLLFCAIFFMAIQAFSFSPGNAVIANPFVIHNNFNSEAIQEFLKLTPKKYQELTGIKMTFRQKLAFYIFKSKLKKQLTDKTPAHKSDIGLLSLIFGGGAFVLAIVPVLGALSIPMAITAIVLGIIGLGRKKGDTKSIIGLVLGSIFLLLIVAVVAAFASGSWWH